MSARVGVAGLLAAAAVLTALDGSASAQLPPPPYAAASPTYSPDGRQVAYAVHHKGDERGWLVVGSANGRRLHSVYSSTDSCCTSIAWTSPTWIVFVDDYQLKRVDLRSGNVATLSTGAAYFRLSPNRQTIAIADGCECNHAPDAVAFVGVDGRGYRVISKPKNVTDELDGFSPDGTELVFSRYPYTYDNPRTNQPSLYAVPVRRGAMPVPISQSGLIGISHLPADADGIDWSHDGSWLSFFTTKGLWLMSTATGKARLAVSYRGPGAPSSSAIAWSPISDDLAYGGIYPSGKRTKAGPVLVTRLTRVTPSRARAALWKNALTYLTDTPGDRPQWAPDGKSLIFLARPLGSRAWATVYVVDTNGKELHQLR